MSVYIHRLFCNEEAWLGQANHIFSRLHITSTHEDYGIVYSIDFGVKFSATQQNPPDGYLFLCPTENFQSGPSSFQWPDGPAYWLLDSSGVERLSVQAASALGFSAIELTMDIWGHSWAARVYEGVRRFHQAKGFDPDSQDVARHLDYPPYELSSGQDIPFAHVEDEHGATHDEEIQKLAENGEDDRLGSDDDDSVLGLNTFTPGDENPETLT